MRRTTLNTKRDAARGTRIDAGVASFYRDGWSAADCAHVLRIPIETVRRQYAALLQQKRDRRAMSGATNFPSGLLHAEAAVVAFATATIAECALAEFHPVPADREARRIARRNARGAGVVR
jgi:hypothetical protein